MNRNMLATVVAIVLMVTLASSTFADSSGAAPQPPQPTDQSPSQPTGGGANGANLEPKASSLGEPWKSQLRKSGLTISEIRTILIGKSVRIGGEVDVLGNAKNWTFAKKSGNHYRAIEQSDRLSPKYRTLDAKVVAVELTQSSNAGGVNVGGVNAFGEAASDDAVKDPPFDVFVKFENGKLAAASLSTIELWLDNTLILPDERKAFAGRIAPYLAGLVGRDVYATSHATVYRIDTSIEDLRNKNKLVINLVRTGQVPLLKPLRVAGAKYLPDDDVVVLKLVLPDGSQALGYNENISRAFVDSPAPVDEALVGGLELQIPAYLTPEEVAAIQQGTFFQGMSMDALELERGRPDDENDSSDGSKQLIYRPGPYVYVGSDGKITSWQY